MMITAESLAAIVWPAIALSAGAPFLLIWLVWRDLRRKSLW